MKAHASSDRIKIPPGFWEGLNQLGIAAHEVARTAGLPLTVITEPAVTTAQYFAIWQAYSDLTGDPAESIIKLVGAFETAKYPPTVLAPYHARDYRDALYRMARYKQMCPPEGLRISEERELCTIELAWVNSNQLNPNQLNPEQPGPPVLTGITLAFLLELGRRGTGQLLKARSVEFVPSMGNTEALEVYFGCPVRTGAKRNRLVLDRKDLDRPFLSYNEELLDILTPALDKSLEEQKLSRTLTQKVKWILKRSLTGGRPEVQNVSRELGMSDRTLQRRLSEEQTSFHDLLTQTRHEQALEYLADPSLDLKEVAFLIGYEDQNSFFRAFRLWEGDTPASWRSRRLERQ